MLLCFTCYSVEFVSVKMDLPEYFSLLHWLDGVDVKLSPCIHYNFRGSWKFGVHKSIEIRLVMKPSFITIPIVAYIYELTMYFVNKFFKAPDYILIGKNLLGLNCFKDLYFSLFDASDKLEASLYKNNPIYPNISMHILPTVLYTFPKVLTRRICLTTKSYFS